MGKKKKEEEVDERDITKMSEEEVEEYLKQMFNDPTGRGLKRIAICMTNPIRNKLNESSLARQFLETDVLPQGVSPCYDKDSNEYKSTVIEGRNERPKVIDDGKVHVEVPMYEIATVSELKYAEVSVRRKKSINKLMDRLFTELKRGEEKDLLSIFKKHTEEHKNVINIWDKSNLVSSLLKCCKDMEKNLLKPDKVLFSPQLLGDPKIFSDDKRVVSSGTPKPYVGGFKSIIRLKGENNILYDLKIYYDSNVNQGQAYIAAAPKNLGRMPIRYDVEIKPFDYPPERAVLFSCYEHIGLCTIGPESLYRLNIGFDSCLSYAQRERIKAIRDFWRR